jgi:ribosome-interacting GTPase 1
MLHSPLLEKELESCGIRLNREPPKISYKVRVRVSLVFALTSLSCTVFS